GDIYYVGKSDPLSLVEGTIEEPFVHPGQAIAQASAGDCIVLLPGIYHDTLLIDNQFPADLTIRSYAPTRAETPTIFWVTNSVKDPNLNYGSAVLLVQDNNPVFDGFIFKATNPFGDHNVSALRVAVFDTATSGAMLANSVITGFDDPNNNETLIRVVDNSQ